MSGVIIKELMLKGPNKKDAQISLKRGINIISGPSNTGKTFVFECIEYMLGKTKISRRIGESKGYEEIYLQLSDAKDKDFTVSSDFYAGDFKLYECKLSEINSNSIYRILKREHDPKNKNTLSNYILEKCNFKNSFVRTNAAGKKRELALSDLRHFHLINELKVPTMNPPFISGQYTTKTVEENVFKLLLTGKDDSDVTENQSVKVTENQRGKIELLTELLKSEDDQGFSREKKSQIKNNTLKIERKLNTILSGREELIEKIHAINQLILDKKSDNFKIKSRIDELLELTANSKIIEKQYASDVSRLSSTIEAGLLLKRHELQICPVCNSDSSVIDDCDIDNINSSCISEMLKINGLIKELIKVREIFSDEVGLLTIQSKKLDSEIEKLNINMSIGLKSKLNKYHGIIDKLNLKIMRNEVSLNSMTYVENLVQLKKNIEGNMPSSSSKKRKFVNLNSVDLQGISKKMLSLLIEWGYPNIESVSYSETSKDFLLSGEDRVLAGKGFRAISYSAFIIAFLTWTKNKDKKFGFAMIDSPLVTYRKPDVPDGEEISEDMAKSFYLSLVKFEQKDQLIIIENEEVPESIKPYINDIHFTRNHKHGRYGFIPTSIS